MCSDSLEVDSTEENDRTQSSIVTKLASSWDSIQSNFDRVPKKAIHQS